MTRKHITRIALALPPDRVEEARQMADLCHLSLAAWVTELVDVAVADRRASMRAEQAAMRDWGEPGDGGD